MKGLAAVALAVAVFVPASHAPAHTDPRAEAAAPYLTIREAKREIRARVRRDARAAGERLESLGIPGCRRRSRQQVRCGVYWEESDRLKCDGRIQVTELRTFYRTREFDVDCYY